jgi:hypothetical protein
MYEFIEKFHSGWAYIALTLLVATIINSSLGFFSKREFTPRDKKIALFTLIAAHTQLLAGFCLYFLSNQGFNLFQQIGAAEIMKNANYRLMAVEHPVVNIIAIVLITIGWSKHKKSAESGAKFKLISIFYGIGLLLLLSRIPWSMWL